MREAPVTGDVRELLGMRTRAAYFLVGAFIVTFAVVVVFTVPRNGIAIAAEIAAWAIMSTAVVVFIRVPGDPLPLRATAFLVLAGPVAMALVLSVLPVPMERLLQVWPISAAAVVNAYMCVRGRTGLAWLSMTGSIGAIACWAALTGQGIVYGIASSIINYAPMIMATFFAYTIRPAAREIFEMRHRATEAAAAAAAQSAILEERDRQMVRLDERARPLLERAADGEPLTPDERRACALAEARLRDALRAPALDAPEVVSAVWRARSRGVRVVLLDDHGLDGVSAEVRERIHAAVIAALSEVESGTLTVRVLPPGRDVAVTIVLADRPVRVEFDVEGRILTTRR
ncbi:MAG: hypothetical protein QM809_04585 [Gordonia sp. (in: high G+C Gram-positive bacteria)]|uniref:hypothetical protein n=1 Tax=Gordonia sp. (in: high G+C Gram-positive bacteria) TaxID=84139 RepID=UPI0039E72146